MTALHHETRVSRSMQNGVHPGHCQLPPRIKLKPNRKKLELTHDYHYANELGGGVEQQCEKTKWPTDDNRRWRPFSFVIIIIQWQFIVFYRNQRPFCDAVAIITCRLISLPCKWLAVDQCCRFFFDFLIWFSLWSKRRMTIKNCCRVPLFYTINCKDQTGERRMGSLAYIACLAYAHYYRWMWYLLLLLSVLIHVHNSYFVIYSVFFY